MITSRCTWGAAAEADTIGEEQLNQGATAEADAIGEQQLKQMQSEIDS